MDVTGRLLGASCIRRCASRLKPEVVFWRSRGASRGAARDSKTVV